MGVSVPSLHRESSDFLLKHASIADVYFSGPRYFDVKENIGSVTPCVSSRSEVELRAYLYSSDFSTWFT